MGILGGSVPEPFSLICVDRRGNGGGGEGGAGGMRTVECLRGRLLAERVASKAAKEEADQLAARLDELEKRLSDEVKIRDRAERRLRRAIKRLESLKILDVGSSIGSLSSNSNACSGQQAAPETEESNGPAVSLSTVDSVLSDPRAGGEDKGWDGESVKGSSAGSCTQANSSQDGSWFSVVSEQSGSGACKEESRTEDSDDAEKCGSGDAAGDVDRDSVRRREEQPGASSGSSKSEASYRDEEDDRLALVLVDNPHYSAEPAETKEKEKEEKDGLAMVLADPQPRATSVGGNDVQSVLLALRQVKEQLRYTIQRRSEGLVAHRELCGH
ncbi:unnamed protein product [Triticum turgidum subsp. durum]|uniref:Uncharacterized protein n=1 Tax=Triticum turgidum subsp. durum TaxID=4567 RepID=A0A9R0VY46_TRITD|nr:unnamed protein product [Triticum turgidum subsp. durum]